MPFKLITLWKYYTGIHLLPETGSDSHFAVQYEIQLYIEAEN